MQITLGPQYNVGENFIPPKRFDIFPALTGGCSEGLDALRFFFKKFPPINK